MPVTVRIFFKNDKQSQLAKYSANDAVESGSVAVSFRGEDLAAKYVPAAKPAAVAEAAAEPKVASEPESEPEPAAVPEAKPAVAAPEPEPEPEPADVPQAEPTPTPESEPAEPEPEPAPVPAAAAAPEPEPELEPGEVKALGDGDDSVLQDDTDSGDPSFLEVHLPMKETDGEFGAKDGFAMYVDGARFVPETLAVTNVTVTALSRDLQQQGVARMTGLVYGTDPVCPGFAFRHVYRCGS